LSVGRERTSSARSRASTPSYDDNDLRRGTDLEIDGVSSVYNDFRSERPKNPARKTRTDANSPPESPLSSGRSSSSEQELCDMCKMSKAHYHARARNAEDQKRLNEQHAEMERDNLRALQDREEQDRQKRRANLLATQQANEELMRQKRDQQFRDRQNDTYGALIHDRVPSTPPEVQKARYKDALREQIEQKNRSSAYLSEEKQREREREDALRQQHVEDELRKKEEERRRKEEHSRDLIEQMRSKSTLSNYSPNNSMERSRLPNRPGSADNMHMVRRGRPHTPELKSKMRLDAKDRAQYQLDTINEKKQREEDDRIRQAEEAEQKNRANQEEKQRLAEEERAKKLQIQNDLKNAWADQTNGKRNNNREELHPSHTSLHMTPEEIAEHMRHCKKCGKALGPVTDFRRKSGNYRKTSLRV